MFGVVTDISTEEFLKRRIASAFNGVPIPSRYLKLAAERQGFYLYDWDKNNFQPRISVPIHSGANGGLWHALFTIKSVIRAALRDESTIMRSTCVAV